jgi:hypothetical protein
MPRKAAAPLTNADAAKLGDHRKALEVLRDTLATLLDTEPDAQLARQYRATLAELASLPAPKGQTARERLAERAAAANIVA